jgi:hypothetical protein
MYHVAMLIGRILLRQPASHWPPFFRRPWTASSLRDFWSAPLAPDLPTCFHRARGPSRRRIPGTAWRGHGHLRRVRSPAHCVPVGDRARVTGFHHTGKFYLMGLGVTWKSAFERATGSRVRGWLGWLWTMERTTSWGSLLLDSGA